MGECQDTAKASGSLRARELGAKHDDRDSKAGALPAPCYLSETGRASLGRAAKDSLGLGSHIGMR